jgi:hypothetical protein
MTASGNHGQEHVERVFLYALAALDADEARAVEAQTAGCAECRAELEAIRPTVEAFSSWPTNVLRPPTRLWDRLAQRVASETGGAPLPRPSRAWVEPAWEQAAPGISVKLLATDREKHRVSMLVRLDPDTEYPPHTHDGVEELHLLDGELWIDERRLHPGDYNRAEPGTVDTRVWSATGCTCVLITSPRDVLR